VLDADGRLLWTDDHDPPDPPGPTSKWKPGQSIQYTRTKFVPVFPYLGEATVEIGLHRNDERLPLSGPNPTDHASSERAYRVGTIQFLPSSENIFLIYKSGWHPPEFAAEDSTLEWQWTQKAAVLSFRNPKRDVVFYLDFDARPDVFEPHQQVTISSGDKAVATFPADNATRTLRRINITADQLGSGEMAELKIEVDRAFVPAKLPGGGPDTRELGIRIYHVFVEPQ
jgi:hypothetical protein